MSFSELLCCPASETCIMFPGCSVFGFIVRLCIHHFMEGVWADDRDCCFSGNFHVLSGLHEAPCLCYLGLTLCGAWAHTQTSKCTEAPHNTCRPRDATHRDHHGHGISRTMWYAACTTGHPALHKPMDSLTRKLSWTYRKLIYCTYDNSS